MASNKQALKENAITYTQYIIMYNQLWNSHWMELYYCIALTRNRNNVATDKRNEMLSAWLQRSWILKSQWFIFNFKMISLLLLLKTNNTFGVFWESWTECDENHTRSIENTNIKTSTKRAILFASCLCVCVVFIFYSSIQHCSFVAERLCGEHNYFSCIGHPKMRPYISWIDLLSIHFSAFTCHLTFLISL